MLNYRYIVKYQDSEAKDGFGIQRLAATNPKLLLHS